MGNGCSFIRRENDRHYLTLGAAVHISFACRVNRIQEVSSFRSIYIGIDTDCIGVISEEFDMVHGYDGNKHNIFFKLQCQFDCTLSKCLRCCS